MRNKVLKLFIHDDNNNNVLLAVFWGTQFI